MTTQLSTLPTQCKDLLARPDCYVVLDSETTGLEGEIIDLAIVSLDSTVLFNELLRPQCAIEEGAMAVHGITEAMVASAHTFAEHWAHIQDAIGDRAIIAYNADFDRGRFEHTSKTHGITLPALQWRCFMKAYAEFCGAPGKFGHSKPSWQRLAHACGQQSVDFKQEHRAQGLAGCTGCRCAHSTLGGAGR